jgi:hypothetical protein
VYGTVWRPPVAYGWAPYRYGHWAWVNPWGWTWVDDAAWGFAPFHYGRWAYVSNGWYWVPGPIVRRPVYAPALVAFVGGNHFGVSVGLGGGIGWFPLGPQDYYRPSYRVSPSYVRNVNVTNVTNIYNTRNYLANNGIPPGAVTGYQNQGVPNAVTAVASNNFVPGRPVQGSIIAVPKDIARTHIRPVAAPAAPVGNPTLQGTMPVAKPKRVGSPVITTAVAGTKNGAARRSAALPKEAAQTTAATSPSGAKSPGRPASNTVPPAANHPVADSKPVAKPPVSGRTITNADFNRRSDPPKTENTSPVARPHPPTAEHNTRKTPTGEEKTSQPKKTGASPPPVPRANAFTNQGMYRGPSIPRASFAPSQAGRPISPNRSFGFQERLRPTAARSPQPSPSRSFGRTGGGGHSVSRGSGGGHRRG